MMENMTIDEACKLNPGDEIVFNPRGTRTSVEAAEAALGLKNQRLYTITDRVDITYEAGRVRNVIFKVKEYLGDKSLNETYGHCWFKLQ